MADIELIIKIPEEAHRLLKNEGVDWLGAEHILNAVANGTPLPKGHGKLIDADRLKEEMEKDVRRAMSFVDLTDFVWLAPTIIEADQEQEDADNN